jgi:hypothetical protein
VTVELDDFLAHYGVRGMRWGVRKPRNEAERKAQFSPKEKAKRKNKNSGRTTYQKEPNRLSDKELKDRIARMELEKKYSTLQEGEKSQGKEYAHSVLQNVGRTAASGAAAAVVSYFVQRELKRRWPT